jgi:hypothetical protein
MQLSLILALKIETNSHAFFVFDNFQVLDWNFCQQYFSTSTDGPFGATTVRKITFSTVTLGIMALSITTLSIITFSYMTLHENIELSITTFNIMTLTYCHFAKSHSGL